MVAEIVPATPADRRYQALLAQPRPRSTTPLSFCVAPWLRYQLERDRDWVRACFQQRPKAAPASVHGRKEADAANKRWNLMRT